MSDFRDLRIAGELISGVTIDGVTHKKFELRCATVQDNIDAVDEVGGHNSVALNAAIMSRQLVMLGTLKPKQITYELVVQMHPTDFNAIDLKSGELEKKRLAAAVAATDSTSTESGSASSAPA